jgi:cytochrome c oxidase subunit 2
MSSTPRRRRPPGLLLAGIAVAVFVAVSVATVFTGVIDDLYPVEAVTNQAAEIRSLYDIVFAIAAVIFLLVEGLILWTVIRYRRDPDDDELPPQIHGHFGAEIVWTVVPTLIVAVLFVLSWQTLNTVEAISAQPDLKIRAVAGQFQWTFDYMPASYDPATEDPEAPTKPVFTQFAKTESDGGMYVPVERSVQLYLHSPDVIHAFYVPQFLFKRDVVPGVTNTFEFTLNAEHAGRKFNGQCAELCGIGHRIMLFDVVAQTGSEFDAWYAEQEQKASATPAPPPSGEPEGARLELVAEGVAFEPKELSAPADQPFTIHLDNRDATVPHDVAIRQAAGQPDIFKGETFPGSAARDYAIPPLPAGTYEFYCTVHPIPAMTGTLTVGQ